MVGAEAAPAAVRKPGFFSPRRLRWKLTASYTLVTVATIVTVQALVLVVGVLVLREALEWLPRGVREEMSSRLAPQVSPYLQGEAPDLEGIHRWLATAGRVTIEGEDGGESDITFDVLELVGGNTRLLVLDREGRLLGSTRQAAAPVTPQPFDPGAYPGLPEVLPGALIGGAGEREVEDARGAEHLAVAVPVLDGRGTVVGALALAGPYSPTQAIVAAWAVVIVLTVLGAILFTVMVGLIGTTFGWLTARGLTRRLDRVTATAAAWGRGDFSHAIKDRSGDEIGQLGRQLNRMAVQLEELIGVRQELSAVNERNRLARDLHDSVKQQVFAVSMNLGAADVLWEKDPDAARARVEAARELVRQCQHELTAVIQALRPLQLEDKGLRQALADHLKRWESQTGVAVTFEAAVEGALPLPVEEALFRVAQEALANVARHSRATGVRVALTARDGEARLRIEDNGRGFERGRTPAGVGLDSMRERVQALGGELSIESGTGGTSVRARVPVKEGVAA